MEMPSPSGLPDVPFPLWGMAQFFGSGAGQDLLDALPIGVYACDAEGRILRVNRRAMELWGRAPGSLEPERRFCGSFHLETLDHVPILPHQTPMARAVLQGESCHGAEAIVQNEDGKRWIAKVVIEPLRDADGRLVGAINCFRDVTAEHELHEKLQRQQHSFDLAMTAAQMGTWRYSFADNICIYDDNAQRLYGLSEARFVHDGPGAAEKFHPDDVEPMWERVRAAIEGDGRYDVEYRVRQPDGSWRWLSAWGVVEYEGRGDARKPVAISGVSRDLTERKQAEEIQVLLNNELNHRVKNTLATVQSMMAQTLRSATDLPAARKALDRRIMAMAQAHDLLTFRAWTGANLADIVELALKPFTLGQVDIAGDALDVSSRHTLALSLALHELATNATKYGALSNAEGRVAVHWLVRDEKLELAWDESGGPAVTEPTRQGFGSRLIQTLIRDLDGEVVLDYRPGGLHCRLTARL